MITPYSQFVVSQSAINVAMKERYKLAIDEVIMFAQGVYGDDSGYTWMDQNLKDRVVALPRARELAGRTRTDIPLKRLREEFGGPGVSDEEFLLRYIMKGEQEIAAMRAAGPPKQYCNTVPPLLTLIRELKNHAGVRHIQVRRGSESLRIENRSAV